MWSQSSLKFGLAEEALWRPERRKNKVEVTFLTPSAIKVQIFVNELTSEVFGAAQELEAITFRTHTLVLICVAARARWMFCILLTRRIVSWVKGSIHLFTRRWITKSVVGRLWQGIAIFSIKVTQVPVMTHWWSLYWQKQRYKKGKIDCLLDICADRIFYINLPALIDLKRWPTPKLGDLRPKVEGSVCVNSLFSFTWPAIDLNRLSFEKEKFAFVGEKLTCSWVKRRHLCFPELDSVMMFVLRIYVDLWSGSKAYKPCLYYID